MGTARLLLFATMWLVVIAGCGRPRGDVIVTMANHRGEVELPERAVLELFLTYAPYESAEADLSWQRIASTGARSMIPGDHGEERVDGVKHEWFFYTAAAPGVNELTWVLKDISPNNGTNPWSENLSFNIKVYNLDRDGNRVQ